MKAKFFHFIGGRAGTTFVELLLYIAIFLVLTPILLMVSINAVRLDKQHNVEKQVSADSQFAVERISDLISGAKKVSVASSVFNDPNGRLTLVMQDDSMVTVALDPVTKRVRITEHDVTSDLTPADAKVESMYFERIADQLNDPEIVFGVNVRLNIAGLDPYSPVQQYVTSSNLERGDFDNDGSPDTIDKFAHHPECTGDGDGDGVCDELDNAVLSYNPFQEDYDADGVGDVVDSTPFGDGGGGGGGSGGGNEPAFNCSSDQQLLDAINAEPPMGSMNLKQLLIAASPLSPTVLTALIDKQDSGNIMGVAHFRQVLVYNVKLTTEVYQRMLAMENFPNPHRAIVVAAQIIATIIPWLDVNRFNEIDYPVTHPAEAYKITFGISNYPLGADMLKKTDIFVFSVENGPSSVTVTTTTSGGSSVKVLNGAGSSVVDDQGFGINFDYVAGKTYIFKISSYTNTNSLQSVTFDFGEGATVTQPSGSTYHTHRYTYYCPGGCATQCGDVGTGIVTGRIFTDRCYRQNGSYPEWCSKWLTFSNDNSTNPAFMGGTQTGEETLYWEKSFKTILTPSQLEKLESITIAGEVAYQSTAQFFCDQFQSSCPMNGTLTGAQDAQLYNWQTSSWETVGVMGLNGAISDQQTFEILYNNPDALKFVGGDGGHMIKARLQFHWNGVPAQGQTKAPSFMLVDFFTIHLKW